MRSGLVPIILSLAGCGGLKASCPTAMSTTYADVDGDGWGDENAPIQICGTPGPTDVVSGGDCDDSDPTIYPGADEVCDGIDRDCNGAIDDGLSRVWAVAERCIDQAVVDGQLLPPPTV